MKNNKSQYLYHGSVTPDIKMLEPRKRYTPSKQIEFGAIYATPLEAYAVAHSFPWESDESFDLDVINERVIFKVPEKFKERLQVPIYIYKVSSDTFELTKKELTSYTWHSTKPVPVIEVTKYESVEYAILKLGGNIIYT